MISVILYGRNDAHGYNLHKRAAISLNCIGEVLSDPGDEILFLDCNTSNDLPTFIEAIYDTLTEKARRILRVFRLRPELYSRLVGQTHLFATEPHTRNIALRRSNPSNRWVLSTNTDMIFVPNTGWSSLSDAVRDLPDGFYVTPRFELPEPLWESFPRSEPRDAMRLCESLGPKLHLYEVPARVPYMRFDSPGDFQLAPRHALFDICGFDERMTHGWHVDSNMCKRLYLFFGGRTESLADRVRGYHCDHTRVATLAHRADLKLDNNLQQFVWDVTDPVARHQAETWGAPHEDIEEVDFANGAAARYAWAVERSIGIPQQTLYCTDCNDARNFVHYPPERALPYLAANFTVYPPSTRFLYAGNSPRMLELTTQTLNDMGFGEPLNYVSDLLSAGDAPEPAVAVGPEQAIAGGYDCFIFDFGLDGNGVDLSRIARVTDWPRDLRYSLGAVTRCMEASALAAGRTPKTGGRIPDFLVLNANHYLFQRFSDQLLLSTETPYPLHVRKGRPRVGDEVNYRGADWKYTRDLLCSFIAYDETDHSIPAIAADSAIDFTTEGRSARHKDGHWGAMDYTGSWTDGHTAALLFAPPASLQRDLIAQVRINEAFLGLDDDRIRIRASFERQVIAHWDVYSRFEVIDCKALLPAELMAGKDICRLEFHIENPHSPEQVALARGDRIVNSDPRELGVKVQSVRFTTTDVLAYSIGRVLDFTDGGTGAAHCNVCWSQPDNYGQWTLGPDPNLVLLVNEPLPEPLWAVFTITDAAVNTEHPKLGVDVEINGDKVAEWALGPNRITDERRVFLADGIPSAGAVLVSFRIGAPRTPKELNWSSWDLRPLGFRLTRFRLERVGAQKYKLGNVIDLTDQGNSAGFVGDALGTQWAQPDRFGSWTLGREAVLKIELEDAAPGPVPVSFIVSDWVASKESPALPVVVKANGVLIGQWSLDSSRGVHRRILAIPAEAIAGRTELLLTFEIPTPRSPQSLGWSGDSRPLGLRLALISIGSAEVPMPAFGRRGYIIRRVFERALGLPAFARYHAARLLKWWYER